MTLLQKYFDFIDVWPNSMVLYGETILKPGCSKAGSTNPGLSQNSKQDS